MDGGCIKQKSTWQRVRYHREALFPAWRWQRTRKRRWIAWIRQWELSLSWFLFDQYLRSRVCQVAACKSSQSLYQIRFDQKVLARLPLKVLLRCGRYARSHQSWGLRFCTSSCAMRGMSLVFPLLSCSESCRTSIFHRAWNRGSHSPPYFSR